MSSLNRAFYTRTDTVKVAKQLLGKILVTSIDGYTSSGVISETEAYLGKEDRASHAYGNRRTARTEIMFREGGIAYVYLCYGIHHLFNVVTNEKETAHAVLVRNIRPLEGIDIMLGRRNKQIIEKLTTGPGTVTQALGIDMRHNGIDLLDKSVWIEEGSFKVREKDIEITSRVGVDYAGEDALLPYRFLLKDTFKS